MIKIKKPSVAKKPPKSPKSPKSPKLENSTKKCPEGKELNPKTGRCIMIKKAKAAKNKSPKLENSTKKCPEGKVLNPDTGRCILIKKIPENVGKRGRPKNTATKDAIKNTSFKPIQPKNPIKSPNKNKKSKSPSNHSSLTSSHSSSHLSSFSYSPSHSSSSLKNDFELYYPDLDDPEFTTKISNNKEFSIHKIPDFPVIENVKDFDAISNKLCGKFDKMLYQHFVSQYISYRTPYKSLLLYHGVGVGKTCSAVTIAEALLSSQTTSEPMIWVIMPQSLSINFKNEVFKIDDYDTFEKLSNQCTEKNYIKLLNIYKSTYNNDNNNGNQEYREKLKNELNTILKSRYEIFTYDRFAKYIKDNYNNTNVTNKVIIIDEAHNIRSTNKKEKGTYTALIKCLKEGVNNRLILLSATPMYNEPRDILELLKLLIINDKRDNIINDNKKFFNNNKNFDIKDINIVNLIKKLSNTYISYLKGKNPFTFALKLKPSNSGIKVLEKAPTKDMNNKKISKENIEWLKNMDDDIVVSKLGEAQKNIIEKLEKIDINSEIDNDLDIGEYSDEEDEKHNNNMKLLQPMNIVYDTAIGTKGFGLFFNKTKGADPIELKYVDKYKNALMPDQEHLGKYSGKFLNVCNFIRNSKGIVVIYSRFLLSGIIPIAICLEHLGYKREGTKNILKDADIIEDKPIYEGIDFPKYCILTSDNKEYMGNTKIDDLINIINSDANDNGAKIKVILITPVASEGLSFFNTREIHLIEPWYHFNRSDQIIGRGIRNCRHNRLKIENRNVSVFMHASVNDDSMRESIDINAFRISTRKYIESKKIDKIIMDNAIDCYLMKNINYFPKSIFKLDHINLETSQGALIKYNFGDSENNEPTCNINNNGIKINESGYRSEVYKHLLANIKNIIKKIINTIDYDGNDGNIYIEFELLKNNIGYEIDNDILMYTIKNILYPNIFINDKYIIRYKNGLLISPIEINNNNKIIRYNNDVLINSIGNEKDEKTNKASNASNASDASNASNASNASDASDASDKHKKLIQKIIDKLDIDLNDINKTTISLYLKISSNDFKVLIEYILKSSYDILDKNIKFICECWYKQGILIKKDDIPSYEHNNNKYIGYVNMYNENTENDNIYIKYNKKEDYNKYLNSVYEFELNKIEKNIILYNMTTNNNQNISKKYIKEFFSNRIHIKYIPDMTNEKTAWGIIVRVKNKKAESNNKFKYIFNLFTIGNGNKTGRNCETLLAKVHNEILNQLISDEKIQDMKNNKILCSYIANLLLNKNKLILYPLYKPKL
jgi:hypothetical protein